MPQVSSQRDEPRDARKQIFDNNRYLANKQHSINNFSMCSANGNDKNTGGAVIKVQNKITSSQYPTPNYLKKDSRDNSTAYSTSTNSSKIVNSASSTSSHYGNSSAAAAAAAAAAPSMYSNDMVKNTKVNAIQSSRINSSNNITNNMQNSVSNEHNHNVKVTKVTNNSTNVKQLNIKSKPLQDWDVPDRYEVKHLIGSGSYGHVCEACDHKTKKIVAIKRIHHVFEDLVDCKRILREIAILNRLKHNHIVSIIDIVPPKNLYEFNELYVVLEIADSDFKKLFRSPVFLSEVHVQTLLYNLLIGLKYIHSASIFHRDLKPANCLVNQDCTVKICDFGLARTMDLKLNCHTQGSIDIPGTKNALLTDNRPISRQLTGHVVTRWYRAPELILLQENYTEAIDVWSVGCIFAELLGTLEENCPSAYDRQPLFPGASCFPLSPDQKHNKSIHSSNRRNQDQLSMIFNIIGTPKEREMEFLEKPDARKYIRMFRKYEKKNLYDIYPGGSHEGVDLLQRMLVFDPKNRITIDEALEHSYFSKIRNIKLEKNAVAESKVLLPFNDWADLTEDELRQAFLREIQRFHPYIQIPNYASRRRRNMEN